MFARPFCVIVALSLTGCSSSLASYFDSSATPAAGDVQASDNGYQLAKDQLTAGNYGLAINSFQDVLARNPKSIEALNGIAIAYAKIGRKDVATQYFNKALEINARSPVTLNNIAYFHLTNGDPQTAVAYADRAVKANTAPAPTARPELSTKLSAVLENNFTHARTAVRVAEGLTPAAAQPEPKPAVAVGKLDAPSENADRAKVAAADETAPAARADDPTVRVSNGAGFDGLAAKTAGYLAQHGVHVSKLTNEKNFDHRYSAIYYNPGLRAYAEKLAANLPMHPDVIEATRGRGEVEVILGADAAVFAGELTRKDS